MHTDLTFFTNEPDRNLYERFSNILKSNTQFFDVLVGYFRTSGFFKMYEAMADVEKIRILVGLNVDKYTVKIIDKANNEIAYDKLTTKEAKEAIDNDIVTEFEKSETSAAVEQGVRTFIDWLKSGKLELRMYVDAPIHAKVYIMRKDMNKTPDTYGSVITGSSNFSEAGLQNNLEFNVELKDSRDVKFALEKFEELWAQSVPITDEYIEAVEKKTYKIVEPKTESGVRQVPMTEEVAECFKRIIQNRVTPKKEPMIDGYVGFIFLDKDGRPMVAMHWEKYFQHICQKYNSIYKVQMPKGTPHVCRHTFCSRMASARMNPKTLQYIMGHSDIGVTLNVYTHLGFDEASEEINRIAKEKKEQPAIKDEKLTKLKVV